MKDKQVDAFIENKMDFNTYLIEGNSFNHESKLNLKYSDFI